MRVKLCILNLGSVNQESIDLEFDSLMAINKKYPEFSYHMLRQVYLQSTKREIRKLHPNTQKVYDKIRIYDLQKDFN